MDQSRILVVYHSCEGRTASIADRIAEVLRGEGIDVALTTTEAAPAPSEHDAAGEPLHRVRARRGLSRPTRRSRPARPPAPNDPGQSRWPKR